MAEAIPVLHWDHRNEAQRAQFAKFLAPLVAASRTKSFTKAEAMAYMISLNDVPHDVLGEAITALLRAGVTWMPKAGDIKEACCDVVDARRKTAARQARALQEGCDCFEGWRDNGKGEMERCLCFTRVLKVIAEAGEPLKRPALPPSSEEEALIEGVKP